MFTTETDALQKFLQGGKKSLGALRRLLRDQAAAKGLSWGMEEEARFLSAVRDWGC